MPTLAFQVQADYEKVMRLREEIHKLKEEMKGVDAVNSPHQFNVLNQSLQKCTSEYNKLTTEAVKAGIQMETGFKKKIYDAQQGVNSLSEEIIKQRKIIADTREDLNKLNNQYRQLRHNGQKLAADGMLPQLNAVKKAYNEQCYALFELTQQKAQAQLGVKKLREEYALFAKESGASTSILAKMKSEIMGLGAGMLAGFGLKELGAEIIRVRGQFQQADTAIQTMLGSKARADELLARVREYAKISPLEFGDITKATQMMLGFNIEAEKVPGYIKAIGDVSMGEAGRFNSLTLAFSQMTAAGKLMGQDLLQMINAGFNPLTIMAEKTGKSVAQLKEEMSKGAITAEMVQQAFIDATSAGGKFYNMSENAAKTINGQLSMMHDALDAAMNDIGKASDGVIMDSISGVTKLIENYETMGRVLLGLATTYGTYRTALALVTFAENGHTLTMTIARAQILLTQKAQALLNATMLANPYVLAAAALGGLIGLLIATSDSLDAAEHAQKNFNATIEENNKKVQQDKEEIDKLLAVLTDENEAQTKRTTAYQTLIDKYPEIFAKYKTEKELIDNLTEARKRENAEIQKKAKLLSQQQYDDAKQRAKDLRRLQQLFSKAHLTGKEMVEKDALQRQYNDYIRENGGNGLVMSNAVNKAADAAQKEFNLNVDENRKKQVAERNKRYKEMKKEQAEAEKKRINALIKKANEAGKKYITLGGEDEPVSVDQAKSFVQTLDENLNTTRKTLKDWRKGAEEEAKKNKKTQQDLEESTELLTKEEAQKKVKDATANNQKLDQEAKSFKVQDKAGDAARKKEEAENKKKIEAAEKLQKFMDKQKLAEERAAKDLEFSTRDAEIKAMQDGTAKTLRQLDLNKDKELEAIERAYEDLRQKRIDEAKQLWDADPSNNGKNFFESDKFKYAASDDRYTEAERTNKAGRIQSVQEIYNRSVKDAIRNEEKANEEAISRYVAMFGDYAQQKQNIYERANDKICELEEQMQTANTEEARQAIEAQVAIVKKGAQDEVDELDKKFGKTAHALGDLFADASKKSVSQIDKLLKKYKAFMQYYSKDGVSKDDLVKKFGFTDKEIEEITQKLKTGEVSLKEYQDGVEKLQQVLSNKSPWKSFTTKIEELNEKINKSITDGDFDNAAFGEALQAVGDQIDQMIPQLDQLGEAMGSIFHFEKSEYSDAIKGLQSFGNLAQGVGQIYAGDYIGGIANVGSGIAGIISIFNSEEEEMRDRQRERNTLSDRLSALNDSVQRLTEKLDEVYGAEALIASEEARLKAIEKQEFAIDQLRDSVFKMDIFDRMPIGGKTHMAYVLREMYGMGHDTEGEYYEHMRQLREAGFPESSMDFLGVDDWEAMFASMANEEIAKMMKDIKENHEDLWAEIINMNDAYGEEYFNAIIEAYDQLEEIERKAKETITQTSFDTVFSTFMSGLEDLANGSEDVFENVAENWQKMVNKMVLYNLMGNKYKKQLEEWYDLWDQSYSADYNITKDELEELRTKYNNILRAAADEIDVLRESGLIKSLDEASGKDQTATISMAEKVTYDQFDTYLGIATAQQIAQEQIKDRLDSMTGDGFMLMSVSLEQMVSISSAHRDIADETRDIMARSYLELQEANEHLGKIEKSVDTISTNVNETRKIINDRL